MDFFYCLTLTDINDFHEVNFYIQNIFISKIKKWLL
ncbi:MAG: Imm15 family immunity protein [Candidatus Malihini olakiniferum]